MTEAGRSLLASWPAGSGRCPRESDNAAGAAGLKLHDYPSAGGEPAVRPRRARRLLAWRTSSRTPYETGSAASDVRPARFSLRIVRAMQLPGARGKIAECEAKRSRAGRGPNERGIPKAVVRPAAAGAQKESSGKSRGWTPRATSTGCVRRSSCSPSRARSSLARALLLVRLGGVAAPAQIAWNARDRGSLAGVATGCRE